MRKAKDFSQHYETRYHITVYDIVCIFNREKFLITFISKQQLPSSIAHCVALVRGQTQPTTRPTKGQ